MIDMASLAGLVYMIGKDARNAYLKSKGEKDATKYKRVRKKVNANYIKDSGLQDAWEKKGYKLYWARPENIATYKLRRYEVMYGIDEKEKKIFSLKQNDTVLMGKNESNQKKAEDAKRFKK